MIVVGITGLTASFIAAIICATKGIWGLAAINLVFIYTNALFINFAYQKLQRIKRDLLFRQTGGRVEETMGRVSLGEMSPEELKVRPGAPRVCPSPYGVGTKSDSDDYKRKVNWRD
jgi:hypothetical protein